MRAVVLLLCVALWPPAAPAFGQERAAPPPLRSESLEVMVDAVIRDKRGRFLHGLKPDAITVFEDGIQQLVTSFREVRIATPSEEALPNSPLPPASAAARNLLRDQESLPRQPRLVSLVYDRLGPEGRRLSRQASLDLLGHDHGPNTYYGVFYIDRGFRVIQPYTNDPAKLRLAIERATSGERSNFSSDMQAMETVANSTRGSQGAAEALLAASQGGRGPGPVDGGLLPSEQAARMVKEMSDLAEQVNREDVGRMSIFSLWGVVKGLKQMPGRKAALYFAEGLQMPNGLIGQFRALVSDANRANVSIYALDARGLTTASDQTAANLRLAEAAQWSRYVTTTEREDFNANKQEFRTFDRAIDSIYLNPQNTMRELAESTGGFLIGGTNDLRPGLQRLSEEFNTYYEITYRPMNQLLDGSFRAISVKVNDPGAIVQARNGYFALPAMEGQTVFPFEVELLKTLSRRPLPRTLDFRAHVLRLHQEAGIEQSVLVFDLPLGQVAFTKDEEAGKYRTHVSVLALLKDEQGRVVAKLSRDVPLHEPLDRLEGFRQGRFIVTRTVRLPPGRYLLESAAADYEGRRAGARRSVLVIQPHRPRPDISEICLVRRVEPMREDRDLLDPFQTPAGRVIPTLIDTVPGGGGRMLSVFFSMYPDSSIAQRPKLILDLVKDGKLLARSVPPLPDADAGGAVPYVANTPLDNVKPGQYEFRATLVQGEAAARKSIYVNVE